MARSHRYQEVSRRTPFESRVFPRSCTHKLARPTVSHQTSSDDAWVPLLPYLQRGCRNGFVRIPHDVACSLRGYCHARSNTTCRCGARDSSAGRCCAVGTLLSLSCTPVSSPPRHNCFHIRGIDNNYLRRGGRRISVYYAIILVPPRFNNFGTSVMWPCRQPLSSEESLRCGKKTAHFASSRCLRWWLFGSRGHLLRSLVNTSCLRIRSPLLFHHWPCFSRHVLLFLQSLAPTWLIAKVRDIFAWSFCRWCILHSCLTDLRSSLVLRLSLACCRFWIQWRSYVNILACPSSPCPFAKFRQSCLSFPKNIIFKNRHTLSDRSTHFSMTFDEN